jgi:hypothetical protein
MTPNELEELAVRKYRLGHPVISLVLEEVNTMRPQSDDDQGDYTDSEMDEYKIMGAMFDEMSDVPPRTGDCAELLADPVPLGRSQEVIDLMAALKASLASPVSREPAS